MKLSPGLQKLSKNLQQKCSHCRKVLCLTNQHILQQTAQGSGGITIPGGVQTMCRYSTSGCGLAGLMVLGWQFGLMILEVFSNLNDSMILRLYDSSEK